MRAQCIQAVQTAAAKVGKTLTQAQLRGIEERIATQRRLLGARDPNFENLTPAEQVARAGEEAAKELIAAKKLKAINVARQIIAYDANSASVKAMAAAAGENRFKAIRRILAVFHDRKANVRSQEQVRQSVYNDAMRGMIPVANATKKFFGFFTDRTRVRNVVKEIMGQDSKDPEAKKAATAISDILEKLRRQFNEAGGNIRKLPYGYLPQNWDWHKVAKIPVAEFVNDFLPALRRSAYSDEKGMTLSTAELTDMLTKAHATIRTDGASDLVPGKYRGTGSLANSHAEARVIHLKDADAWMNLQAKYGRGSILEALMSHIGAMSRDIATLRTWGPNADHGFQAILDEAERAESATMDAGELAKERHDTQALFDIMRGKTGAIANPTVARWAQNVRAMMMFKLGASAVSALSDGANVTAIARINGIPQIQAWLHQLQAWGDISYRQHVRAQGAGLEMINHETVRFGEEVSHASLPQQIASQLLRVFGLNFIDNVRRTGTAGMLMQFLGDATRKHADIPQGTVIASRGIAPEIWQAWRSVQLDSRGWLTPDAIGRSNLAPKLKQQAIEDLIGVMSADVDTVVPMPTARQQGKVAAVMGTTGLARGTVGGEAMRALLQFKSFPIAMFGNAYQRMQGIQGPVGKALYAAEFIATATALGAISVQLNALASGQNPQDMTDPNHGISLKFVARAFVKGGAMGMYGDTLRSLADPHGSFKDDLLYQLGPTFSTLDDIAGLLDAARKEASPEKKQDLGAKSVQFARSQTPMPFYLKAALDHMIFQRLQDLASPGYALRAQARAQKDYNTTYYWPPSNASTIPSPQSPNYHTAFGGR